MSTVNHQSSTVSHGYITLITVLIVSAVAVAIVLSVTQLGLLASQTSFLKEQAGEAESYADACSEFALDAIRLNTAITSTGTVSFTNGDCVYSITDGGGSLKNIVATGSVNTLLQINTITADTSSTALVITLWE